MAVAHGKATIVKVGTNDISPYTKSSEIARKADIHDVTCYGAVGHTKHGGLLDGTVKLDGFYDNTAVTGPRIVLEPLIGTSVSFTRQLEGAGSGKPQDVATVIVADYTETSPCDGMVTWSATLEISGDVNSTAQSA
jgi:hypothetical protein